MGFGWFLIGYFFVAVMSSYSALSFAMLAGYPMMILALRQMAPYHRYFHVGFYISLLSLPFALYYAVYGLSQLGVLSTGAFSGALLQTVEWAYFAFTLLFTAFWLYAVAEFCRELGLPRLQGGALRNLLLYGVYSLLELVARLPIGFIRQNQGYFAVPVLFFRLVVIFLNLYLIFGCYRAIGPEGEDLTKNTKKGRGGKK